jgi:alkanesulfonate monooxygenase SsuD/methylene tetrahydromethanopterin reductase-like flavin-dependent oxidoreductase (luciferase family)
MDFGLMTLGDHLPDPHTGKREIDQAARHRHFVEQGVLAEQAGFDMINLGEHHFCDYILSAPPIVLAAIAERTTTLRLSTAVTLAANLDPLRMAEDYGTVDVLSGGRVEMILGRGALSDTYDILGQDFEQSKAIYGESVRVLQKVWAEEDVHLETKFRPSLKGLTLQPRPIQRPHPPIWIGAGGSEHSFDLAAELGIHLMIPSTFGAITNFLPMVARYQERFAAAGHAEENMKLGSCVHAFVTKNSQDVRDKFFPYYDNYLRWVGDLLANQKSVPPIDFKAENFINGPAMCGSPQQVIDMIGEQREHVDLDLHLAMFDPGGFPEQDVRDSIELYGQEVIPAFK